MRRKDKTNFIENRYAVNFTFPLYFLIIQKFIEKLKKLPVINIDWQLYPISYQEHLMIAMIGQNRLHRRKFNLYYLLSYIIIIIPF